VDSDIRVLWNRINLAMALECLPSEIDNEAHRDMEAVKILLSAKNEYDKRNSEMMEG
jgi:hypothetical protein